MATAGQEAIAPHASSAPEEGEVTEQQMAQVRAQLDPQHLSDVDDDTVRRFIRATGGNLALSAKRLNATCNWRASHRPETVTCRACAKSPRAHYMHLVGHSATGAPIIYSCAGLAENKDFHDNRDHLIQTFETAVKCMPRGVEQWIWLHDFYGFGLSDAMNVRIAKAFLDISGSHYPERLGGFLLVDAPSVFGLMWNALQGLIDPKTYKKIRFLPYDPTAANSKLKEELAKTADEETTTWLLREMAENRDKAVARSKRYDIPAIHKAASQGQLAGAIPGGGEGEGHMVRSATDHDLRGTAQLLSLYHSRPAVLEPQAQAAAK